MSADNGIYILKTPAPPIKDGNCYTNQHGKFEYRVAHCQAIENIDYSDLYMPILFGKSKVYNDRDAAFNDARNLYDKVIGDYGICEYGICEIKVDKYFPNITPLAASRDLDCYEGAVPLDIKEFENEKTN